MSSMNKLKYKNDYFVFRNYSKSLKDASWEDNLDREHKYPLVNQREN